MANLIFFEITKSLKNSILLSKKEEKLIFVFSKGCALGASGAIYRKFRNQSKALAALSTFEPNIESNHIPALERSRFIRRSCLLFKPCN